MLDFKIKTKSLRTKSGKKPSDQEGHEGTTLCPNDNPDEVELHNVEQCIECGVSLKDIYLKTCIVYQIIDIPDIKVKIIEYREEVKIFPHCKSKNTASFLEEIKNTVP